MGDLDRRLFSRETTKLGRRIKSSVPVLKVVPMKLLDRVSLNDLTEAQLSSHLKDWNNSRVVQLDDRQRNAVRVPRLAGTMAAERCLVERSNPTCGLSPYDNNSPAKWGSQTEKRTSIED